MNGCGIEQRTHAKRADTRAFERVELRADRGGIDRRTGEDAFRILRADAGDDRDRLRAELANRD